MRVLQSTSVTQPLKHNPSDSTDLIKLALGFAPTIIMPSSCLKHSYWLMSKRFDVGPTLKPARCRAHQVTLTIMQLIRLQRQRRASLFVINYS